MKSTNSDDFDITNHGNISSAFIAHGVQTFSQAMAFVRTLPYGRNKNKDDLKTVFADGFGTCSTKHALLKQLAAENHADFVTLKLGVYKMNKKNTPAVAATLEKYGLDHIPEAHNYLEVAGKLVDCTGLGSGAGNFVPDLISEITIEPSQITGFKVAYHKNILESWLRENNNKYTTAEIWTIREECIAALQTAHGAKRLLSSFNI